MPPRNYRRISEEEGQVPEWETGNAVRHFTSEHRPKRGLALVGEDGRVSRQLLPVQKPVKRPHESIFSSAVSSERVPDVRESELENPVSDVPSSVTKRRRVQKKKVQSSEKGDFDSPKSLMHGKMQIAALASAVVADPEGNIALLGELRGLSRSGDKRIAALAVLTESQLYNDICPAYRVRPIMEEELGAKVSKDIARLRNFEHGLLAAYRRFLSSAVSLSRWSPGDSSSTSETQKRMRRLRRASCTALIEVSRGLMHFNFADEIVPVVANFTMDRDSHVRTEAARALEEVLGETHRCAGASLTSRVELAQCLSKIVVKRSVTAPPEALSPLLAIKFSSFPNFTSFKSEKSAPKKKFNRKHSKKLKKSEADKVAKEHAERERQEKLDLDRDMQEAHAEATPQELYAAKKSLLSSVCLACFNVIKRASEIALLSKHGRAEMDVIEADAKFLQSSKSHKPPPALSEALQGIFQVSSTIDENIVDAILAALVPLLEGEKLPIATRFRCLSAGYSILSAHASSQGTESDSFTRDAKSFDTCLYKALGSLYGPSTPLSMDESVTVDAVKAVVAAFRWRKMPLVRAAAIARRLGILAMSQAPTHTCCIGLVSALQLAMPPHVVSGLYMSVNSSNPAQMESLDDRGGHSDTYDPLLNDPDSAGGELSEAWELSALQSYYHPQVRQTAFSISIGSCGEQIPSGVMDPVSVVTMHCQSEGGFSPAPEKTFKGRNRKNKIAQTRTFVNTALPNTRDADEAFSEGFWEKMWQPNLLE